MRGRSITLRKVAAVALFLVGLLIFYVVTPVLVEYGLFVTWLFIWPFFAIFGFIGLSILGLRAKTIAKSLLVAYAFVMPWSLIFFIPIPADIQILLAGIISMLSALIYWFFFRVRHNIDAEKPS